MRGCVGCNRTALKKNLSFLKEYEICRYELLASLGSVSQNLVVDYPLVIFCNQQGHIGTNVNYLCAVIISVHMIFLSFVLSRAELWIILNKLPVIPAGIYIFKVNNWNTRRRSGVFIVKFEHISHLFLVFLLLTSDS